MLFFLRTLLFLLFPLFLFAQSDSRIDSLYQELELIEVDSLHFELLNTLIANVVWDNPKEGVRLAERFDSLANVKQLIEKQAHAQKLLGICYHVKDDYDESINHYLQSIKVYEQLRDTFNIGMIYNNIGASYDVQGNHEKSLSFFQKAKIYFDQTDDIEWQSLILQNIATQYGHQDQNELSLANHQKALALYEKQEAQADAFTDLYEARISIILTNIADVLLHMERWEEALLYSERALSLPNKTTDQQNYAQLLNIAGKAHTVTKQYGLAEEELLTSLYINRSLNKRSGVQHNLERLSEHYEARGRTNQALQYLQEMVELKDSIHREQISAKNAELIERYESEKKEQEIARLEAESQLASLRLAKVQQQRFASLLGVLALVIIVGLLLYLWRTKSNQNEMLSEKNQIIEQSLKEKESLLKEIHHRVKNNLQVISSLLSLQERRLNEPESKAAFKASQSRVKSMALIHQNLYQHDDLSRINVRSYFKALSEQIIQAYRTKTIDFQMSVDEVDIDIDTLIPLGLIVNELLCNALKHAFVDIEQPSIEMNFEQQQQHWKLTVRDNGTGITKVSQQSTSFGMKLIDIFARKLQSTLYITHHDGTQFQLIIPQVQAVAS
ncbi:MAG: histidine kinase dimerization/phosphoacceptor domain -containing protein [Bacteroidota bacterium]